MKRAIIRPETCQTCQPCTIELNCTMGAIYREDPADKPWIDLYRCSGCMKCKNFCPHQAVQEILQPCNGKPKNAW